MRLALGLAILLVAGGCDDRPDQWDAFVYPGDDLFLHYRISGFQTFEHCQAAAVERLRSERPDGGGDYECGYKCALDETGLNICEETRK